MKPPLDPALSELVSAALVRLTARSPFLSSLALFARVSASEQVPTAATDGRDVFVNPAFFQKLSPAEIEAVLLHEVLHAALLHVSRRGMRDPERWNIAADIVVNGILAREGYALPAGAVRDLHLERFSAEEAYELLGRRAQQQPGRAARGRPGQKQPRGAGGGQPAPGAGQGPTPPGQAEAEKAGDKMPVGDLLDGPPADAADAGSPGGQDRQAAAEGYWRSAMQQVKAGLPSTVHGTLPGDLVRELSQADSAQLDWRAYLWRFLVQTPVDFAGFDRRFVGQRVYLEALEGESVHVHVAVDTSGSIDPAALRVFLAELDAIRGAYPHLRCDLYYADSRLHGPYALTRQGSVPPPVGGGGTDFRPFFEYVEAHRESWTPALAIYLTDGYGTFPAAGPALPVLWVVTAGGRALEQFPFGEAVRLFA